MEILRNTIVKNRIGLPMLTDVYYDPSKLNQPAVIFNHGFKGFKDWGTFDLIAKTFCAAGFIFIKFNQSHNGTTPEKPTEFVAIERFARNTYSQELSDLDDIVRWIHIENTFPTDFIDHRKIFLFGHSRGASMALLFASGNPIIKSVVAWSPFKSIEERLKKEEYRAWNEQDVVFIPNTRTGENLPQHKSIKQDFEENKAALDIESNASKLRIPVLLVHGNDDLTVSRNDSMALKSLIGNAEFFLIPNADHTFCSRHPWTSESLPFECQLATNQSIKFLLAL